MSGRAARQIAHQVPATLSPAKLAKLPIRALTPEQYVTRFAPARRLDRLVLRDIAAHADFGKRAGQVWGEGAFPSVPGIAERIGYCDRSVQYALRRLVAEGRLELLERPGRTNVCRIVRHLESVAAVEESAPSVDNVGDNSPSRADSATLDFAPGGAKVAPDRATPTNRNPPEGSLRGSEEHFGRRCAPTQAPPERRAGTDDVSCSSARSVARIESTRLTTAGAAEVDAACSQPSPGWAAPPLTRPLRGASRGLGSKQPERRDDWRRDFGCRCGANAGEACRRANGQPRTRSHRDRGPRRLAGGEGAGGGAGDGDGPDPGW